MTPRELPILLRRRTATTIGAVILGLVALAFTWTADQAAKLFELMVEKAPYAPLLVTPLGLALLAWLTRRFAPAARGSGIPQVSAGARDPQHAVAAGLISMKVAAFKFAATIGAILVGASVGREGPTVQISAALMAFMHRLLKIDLSPAVIIAGGAAGVSAAFNTPLAGIAFAIEELAASYHQRLALLAMAAVMISGLVSLGIAGDYIYFGSVHEALPLGGALLIAPLAGVIGGITGGLFSRLILAFGASALIPIAALRRRPIWLALICGLLVAILGVLSQGATWGTGYEVARRLVESHAEPLWFGPAKFLSSLITVLSGVPGGIFAPSLATGAGVGNLIALAFPDQPLGAIVLLGMIGYFVGVVRAPLTAVIIISEMSDSRAMVLPLLATAIIADGISALICREKLYHALAKPFLPPAGQKDV
ncbi:chloride channel protein [Labrys sp. KNU-23]|uniref:chloride channel protein n=1 Tax=Labrys sp. KNU-23 TaxID=2789216 RepID=UPI0011EFE5E8|nr:chloride channel protein [Labrys sp. KNU-23]QEN86123.1 chloride channel protein [Labrys sp. KNU-23]